MEWFVIGIGGSTCSGKSTVAEALADHLSNQQAGDQNLCENRILGSVKMIKQDTYYYKRDSPEHTWIPHLNYINREIISALDMQRMSSDIETILSSADSSTNANPNKLNVLIVEGHLIFNYPAIRDRCHIRFHMYITKELFIERRKTRTYNPPTPEQYIREIIWPHYLQHLKEYEHLDGMIALDGSLPREQVFDVVLYKVKKYVEKNY